MADTLATFTARLTTLLGDQNPNGTWSTTDLQEVVKEAVRDAWPHFFTQKVDSTTYTGNNKIDVTTTDVAVPTIFLPTSTSAQGRVSALEVRYVYPSSYGPWFFLGKDDATIDPLNITSPAPQIHFSQRDGYTFYPYLASGQLYFEMKVWGGVPLAVPANAGDTLDGQHIEGYLDWLMWQCRFLLHGQRETANEMDKGNHGRRNLLAEQRGDKLRRRHGLAFPHLTHFGS